MRDYLSQSTEVEPAIKTLMDKYAESHAVKVYKSEDNSFSRVLLPGKSGKNIIYMTQDLNESNYGTLAIQRAAKLGKTYRITWIIDPSQRDTNYIGLIHTTDEFDLIEQYTSHGTMTLYHSDPKFMPAKSAY